MENKILSIMKDVFDVSDPTTLVRKKLAKIGIRCII